MIGKVLAVLSILIAASASLLYIRLKAADLNGIERVQNTSFDEVAPGLYRLARTWTMIKNVLEVNVNVFLIKDGKNYILIDTGFGGTNYTDLLVNSIHSATKNGNVRIILGRACCSRSLPSSGWHVVVQFTIL